MQVRDAAAQAKLQGGLQPALQAVRRARGAMAMRRALCRVTLRMPWLALLLLVVVLVLAQRWSVPVWAPAVVLLLVAALAVAMATLAARARSVRLIDAALACDRAHDNKDRLSAAFELAGAPRREAPLGEALAAAAIEDGVQRLQAIDAARVATAAAPAPPRYGRALLSLTVLTAITALLPAPEPRTDTPVAAAGDPGADGSGQAPPRADAAAGEHAAPPPVVAPATRPPSEPPRAAAGKRSEPPPPAKAEPVPAVPASSGTGKNGDDEVGDSSQSGAPKAAPSGSPGAGRPGGGQGASAAGAPEPQPEQPRPPAKPQKPKPKAPSKPTPNQEQKASESAGAPSGPSRGSGRMAPVGNKRTDLNRGMDRDDDPDIDDEPIEDESDEQEQRGGVTPLKRQDQRPAARELSISGDGPPDQGRGGPTPPKKARGTASLVLGLRLPDQVRGQPNPGTAKTSMEQIPPRRQQADPGLALPAAAGRLGTPQSLRPIADPYQLLLQAYSARLRQQDTTSPTASTTPR